MSRIIRRSAIAFVSLLVLSLLGAALAPAAKPRKNAHFAGTTSMTPVEGFHAPVTFRVSANGRTLDNFTFGTFGCFGAGGFRPGVNPYTGHSLIDAGQVHVSASGSISARTHASYSVQGQTTTTTISVSGRFSSPKSASGTIVFSQVVTGSVKSSCGPATLTFHASAH